MLDISTWVKENYSLEGQIYSKLIRSYTNDVYLVEGSSRKFILKLYNPVWKSKEEILWEVDLINYLTKKGVPVANVIKAKDGKEVKLFNQNGTEFSAILFEFAKGEKPKQPFTPDLYNKVGKAAGILHEMSAGFSSIHFRPRIDLKYLIDDSIFIAKNIFKNKDELETFEKFGKKLKAEINKFEEKGLDWGVVHGDLTLDNLHINNDGKITFYDFDSAGLGWRAMELQGWVVLNKERKPNIDAYLKGYQEVRNISENDLMAAPYLQAAQDMWLRKGMKALNSHEILNEQMNRVKMWIRYFGE